MRSLWPYPSVVTLGGWRTGVRSTDTAEWLLLPSRRKPWWLLPARRRDAAQALLRHDPGQRYARSLTVLAFLQARGLLRLLPLSRLLVTVPDHDTTVAAHLENKLGEHVAVCVRLGRRRTNRSVVLQVLGEDGCTKAFVKMAADSSAVETLHREAANLERASELLKDSRIRSPQLLWEGTWGDYSELAMSALVPRGGDVHRPDSMPISHMLELARSALAAGVRVVDASYTARQRRLLGELRHSNGVAVLQKAHDFLVQQYGEVSLDVGAWHGDWVPWNMAWSGPDVMLWDWEHFREDVPVGWDLAHYLAQELRIVSGTGPAEEDRWLVETPRLLESELGLDARRSFALMLSYLIEINTRYLTDRATETQTVTGRVGWALPFLSRLTGGPTP